VFTGLVEAVGHIQARSEKSGGQRLLVKSDLGTWTLGESVAVNGVCLTVSEALPHGFLVDVSSETLARSTLGRLAVGSAVNLERALAMGGRMGGHWVTGHVDAVVRWISIRNTGDCIHVTLELPPPLTPFIAAKGSVTIEGVSLTVNEIHEDRFTVTIVPHTQQATTLERTRPGDGVNLEVDILARYVVHALEHAPSLKGESKARSDMALETALIRAGFVHDSK
jgi:riboflavin synthase